MSSPLVSAQVVFSDPLGPASKKRPESVLRDISALPKLAGVTPASRLEVRPAPAMVSSGIPAMDAFTGGLPRGCLTEICGPASSGRTSVLVAALAAFTERAEVCALVDTTDAFNPISAAGVNFERLLWVRCGPGFHAESTGGFAKRSSSEGKASLGQSRPGLELPRSARNANCREVEQALRATDLLLQSGGFGLIAIDLGDVPLRIARRIPLTTWFRFQRAVENTATVLLVIGQTGCAQTCAALLVRLTNKLSTLSPQLSEENQVWPAHARLFEGMQIEGELLRSRMERKPAASVTTFASKAAWVG
jgi:recA bacterial DNA recombination protein